MNYELVHLCDHEDIAAVKALLTRGVDVNVRDENGRTPLMAAVQKNNLELATLLMQHGADLNIRDNTMLTPWLCAGANGFYKIMEVALGYGADIKMTNRFGGTVLLPSSEKGYLKTVEVAIKAGVPVNHVNDLGWSALQEAVVLGNGGYLYSDIISRLMAAGADAHLRDNEGKSALDWAKIHKQHRVMELLNQSKVESDDISIKEIRLLIDNNRYKEAVQLADQGLESENALETFYLKGYALSLLDDHEGAYTAYKTASELPNCSPEFLFYTANALRALKRADEALAEYDLAVSMNPDDFFYRYHKSNYLRELGRHNEAIFEMDELLKRDPNRYDYYFHKANSLRSLGRHEEAVRAMDKAIAADPGNPLYVFHKAQSLSLLGKFKDALTLLDMAISVKASPVYLKEREYVRKEIENGH